MKFFKKNIVKLSLLALIVFSLVFGIVYFTQNYGKPRDAMATNAAVRQLNKLYNSLSVKALTPQKDIGGISSESSLAVLPDISEYPFVVNPVTDEFITIYASSEKSGSGYMNWLNETAEKFNKSGLVIEGKPVSVGIRSIPSSLSADFIAANKYKPDVFAPSSELYGEILSSKNIKINLTEKRLAGNTAGIILSKKANDALLKKYSTVNSKTIFDCVLNNEVAIGYTDPLNSSSGLNLLLSVLQSFDENNPVSDAAKSKLQQFQDNIPYVGYTDQQVRESALYGSLDGFASDYITFTNNAELKSNFEFIPYGVRHDQPLYEIGDLSEVKKQISAKFAEFCKSPDSQAAATSKGFNALEDYNYTPAKLSGSVITQAMDSFKKSKSGTSEIAAVFVADTSGSMDGSPLLKLKASLNRAAEFIGETTNIGLVTFSDTANISLPIAEFDQNQKSFYRNAVKNMTAVGNTAMFDAVVVASKMLLDFEKQNPNTKLMLIVLTDGVTNRGYGFEDVENVIRDIRIPVYTIGYNEDLAILQDLSDLNEAIMMNAESDNVIYKLESLFKAQM